MTKEEKLIKLKSLGIYEQWINNVNNQRRLKGLSADAKAEYVSTILGDNTFWETFIMESFPFSLTPEHEDFWINIMIL